MTIPAQRHAVAVGDTAEPVMPLGLQLPAAVGRILMVIWFFGTAIGLTWSIASAQGQFFLFGMLACLVVTIPLVRPAYAVLGPWSLLAVTIYISCGLRGLFISLAIDGRSTIDGLFLLGHGPGYFTRPSELYVVALALMTIGYLWHPRHPQGPWTRRLGAVRFPPLTGAATVLFALVGFVVFVLYVQRTGGIGLSTKRTTINGLDLDSAYRSHGELRFLNIFSAIALWLHVATHARPGGMRSPGRTAAVALGVNAVLLPLYASSRSDVGYIVLVAFALHYGISGRLPRARTVVRSVLVGVTVLTVMTGLRLASQGGNRASEDTSRAVVDAVSEVLVYNRNFGDMQTTAHIVHAVPNVLPLEHGATITAWVAAPIPRTIWPEKPLLQSGPIIGAKVYGNERSGVPPGFIAEMYWNFAAPGVLIGAVLLGLAMAYVRDTFVPYLEGNPGVALLYGVVLMRLGAYIFVGGVGSGAFKLIMDLVCLAAALVVTRLLGVSTTGPRRATVSASPR